MDFGFSPEEEKLRQEIRRFMKENPLDRFKFEAEDEGYGMGGWSVEFQRKLGKKGWVGLSWPKEYGGQGRTLMEEFVLWDEMAYYLAPMAACWAGLTVGGHPIRIHGNERQKREYLPQVAKGELSFYMGLSEPGAGTDLLALQTRATLKDSYWVISGQKIWGSYAHLADLCILVVRTGTDPNAARHRGLSALIVDLKSPGITVNPIKNSADEGSFCEIFFDEAKVPKENLLGQENGGMAVLLSLLDADRIWGRSGKAAWCRRMIEELVHYAQKTHRYGRPLSKDPVIRDKLAEMTVEAEICRMLIYRGFSLYAQGKPITYEADLLKVFADELGARLTNVGLQISGLKGQLMGHHPDLPLNGGLSRYYMLQPGQTIAGGTSEVIRNTIATRGLGLPRS